MSIQDTNGLNPLRQERSQDSKHTTQLKTIFHYLQNHIATASMVEAATGVHHKCITRYKRDLEKAGQLWEIKKERCQLTGFKAWYLTTDPMKAPESFQTKLF